MRDAIRSGVTAATFAATLALNSAANILPLNGHTTASISDRFPVMVVPAGYVFSIWGLIYLAGLLFTIDQLRPSRARTPLFRRLGYLPAIVNVLNAAWIVAWHWEVFPLSVALIAGMLVTLAAIYRVIRSEPSTASSSLAWTVRRPFSIYIGWITVAVIANIAAALTAAGFNGFGLPAQAWAVPILLVGLAIASTVVVSQRDAAYALVIVWAFAGLAVKEQANLPVFVVAAGGAALMALLAAYAVVPAFARGGRRSGRLTPGHQPG